MFYLILPAISVPSPIGEHFVEIKAASPPQLPPTDLV